MDRSPYQFEVRPGDPDKMLIHFEGGGACWNLKAFDLGICYQSVPQGTGGAGFFNDCQEGRPNPFQNYTVVHVRYCSGDVHLGNLVNKWIDWDTKIDGENRQVTVVQRGYLNAKAAIEWAKANANDTLESLVITGTSAGALGAQVWSSFILEEFNYTSASVIMDSMVGVTPKNFIGAAFKAYNFCKTAFFDTKALKDLSIYCPITETRIEDMAAAVMKTYPKVNFALVTSKYDQVQRFFFDVINMTFYPSTEPCGNGKPHCDLPNLRRTTATERMQLPADSFYGVVNRFIDHYRINPNFHWYILASDHHDWADFVFGDCQPPEPPYFNSTRRVSLQRWVEEVALAGVNDTKTMPQGACEDMPFRGWGGCQEGLGSYLLAFSAAAPLPGTGSLLALAVAALVLAHA